MRQEGSQWSRRRGRASRQIFLPKQTSISLQTQPSISPQVWKYFSADGRKYFSDWKSGKVSHPPGKNISDGRGSTGYRGEVKTYKKCEGNFCVTIFCKADVPAMNRIFIMG